MRNLMVIIVGIMTLVLGACQQNEQETGPDLTTPLAGHYTGSYLIANFTSQPNSVTGSTSLIQLERKNNTTLTVSVNINDGPVQVTDRFDAVISPLSLVEEGRSPVAGLRSRYQFKITNLNNRGSTTSNLSRHDDGIKGGIAYIDASGRLISLVFLP